MIECAHDSRSCYIGAKDDGKIKKGSLPLLKNLIFSRTGKGPRAKNNKSPTDATEPKVGPLLAEARQVVKDYPTSLLPPTPPVRPRPTNTTTAGPFGNSS